MLFGGKTVCPGGKKICLGGDPSIISPARFKPVFCCDFARFGSAPDGCRAQIESHSYRRQHDRPVRSRNENIVGRAALNGEVKPFIPVPDPGDAFQVDHTAPISRCPDSASIYCNTHLPRIAKVG